MFAGTTDEETGIYQITNFGEAVLKQDRILTMLLSQGGSTPWTHFLTNKQKLAKTLPRMFLPVVFPLLNSS